MIEFMTRAVLRTFCAVVIVAGLARSASAESGPWKVVVSSGGTELGQTPLIAPVSAKLEPGSYHLVSGAQNADAFPAQVFREHGKTYLATIAPALAANASKPMTLSLVKDSRSPAVAVVPNGPNLTITIDGKIFTEYRVDEGPKPFFHPLIGPTGESYTRSYPMKTVDGEDKDHPHHRSLWFTYGKLNGIDFWAEPKDKRNGIIKETSRESLVQGHVLARLSTTDDWVGPDGKKVCEDERVVTVYRSGECRILDFDIKMIASEGPVVFEDTKEGMFGVRVASSMDVTKKKGGKITTSERLTDDAAWGKPASWVDYTGPVAGKTVGIAILNHPESFRYPTTWHVRTYGLFAANPFGWHDFGLGKSGAYTLPKGQSIGFRYRVILHAGDTASAKIPQAFQGYAEPPRMSLTAE